MRVVARVVTGAGAAGLGLVGANYAGLGGEDNSVRDDQGAIVEGGEVGAFRLRIGDCIQGIDGDVFESVEAVPCTDLHVSEVYAAFMLPSGEFPGLDEVGAIADDRCYEEIESTIDLTIELDDFGYTSITPTAESWEQLDDREVLCTIGRIDGTATTGSVRLADDLSAGDATNI